MTKKRLKKVYKPMAYLFIGCFLIYILLSQVSLLNDDDYVTRYARENYVFTKDGEQVVILPDIDQEK